jgi:hypothetical protein
VDGEKDTWSAFDYDQAGELGADSPERLLKWFASYDVRYADRAGCSVSSFDAWIGSLDGIQNKFSRPFPSIIALHFLHAVIGEPNG